MRHLSVLTILLFACALAVPAAMAQTTALGTDDRFREHDLNNDGRLSAREWWGREAMFELLDGDNDGYLSRAEFRERGPELDALLAERFHQYDRNRDDRLSLREWWGGGEMFELLDSGNDGYLSRSEVQEANSDPDELLARRFGEKDRNADDRLSLKEWWGTGEAFTGLDRNHDGYVSRYELDGVPEDYEHSDRRFHELDGDRDGRLSHREWPGTVMAFGRADDNEDGFVSLDEWLRQS